MPRVIGNCECITAVRRERHLRLLWFSPVGENLVKNSSDMRCRVVRRQIKLDCDAFPRLSVCLKMRYPGILRVRIGTGYRLTFSKFSPNRRFKPGASFCTKAASNSLERRTRPATSQTIPLFGGK